MATEQLDVLIQGGEIVSGSGRRRGDLAVRDRRFVALEAGQPPAARRVIDARGLLVIPGVIDSHVHPVYDDDLEATSRTAALHGVTTAVCFVGAVPAWGRAGSLTDAIKTFIEAGERRSHVDFAIHGTITAADDPIPQLPGLVELGVPSFKCFMSYKKRGMMLDDERILPFWAALGEAGGLAMVHAENGAIIDFLEDRLIAAADVGYDAYIRTHPPLEEAEAVVRAIALAQTAGCPLYIVHLTVKEGVDFVRMLRPGLQHPLYVETCPHYLVLTNQAVLETGPLAKIGPPIRERHDSEALWAGLADHTLDTIGTDHAAYTRARKQEMTHILDAKYGGPGIGALLPLSYSEGVARGRITLERLVQLLSENPARIFGLRNKGRLEPGADADLVLIDPNATHTIRADRQGGVCDYSMYEGWECQGAPVLTMQRGKVIAERGELTGGPGDGRFVPGRL
jgi:dihydropyrimidinase